jgi:hypothetical protein
VLNLETFFQLETNWSSFGPNLGKGGCNYGYHPWGRVGGDLRVRIAEAKRIATGRRRFNQVRRLDVDDARVSCLTVSLLMAGLLRPWSLPARHGQRNTGPGGVDWHRLRTAGQYIGNQDISQSSAASALAPKADICSARAHVRFGPKADMAVTRIFSLALLVSRLNRKYRRGHIARAPLSPQR